MTTFHGFLGCSLDGYIAGPNGELDWLTTFENTGYDEFFASVQALAMGRRTYEVMCGLAPDTYKGMPIHVLSSTLAPGAAADMGRSPVEIHRDIPSLRSRLEVAGVSRAYVDGGQTVQAFLAAGLLADLTVTRVPVVIGGGIPLFGPVPQIVHAQLVSSMTTDEGAVQSVYRFATT